MSKYYTIITNVGKAKIANAQVLDKKLDLTNIAVGDGVGNPSESQSSLKNELWRGHIGTIAIDDNNLSWIVLEAVMPSDVGGFNIREVGVFDSAGDLIAVGKYPETYKPTLDQGSAKDLYLRMIIEVSNASVVELKIDPTVAIPSREWVTEEIEKAKLTLVPKSEFNNLQNEIGSLDNLDTDEKANLVVSINEVLGKLDNHKAEDATDDVHGLLSDGKIIQESGSNKNGSYVRFADGTQICYGRIAMDIDVNLSTGAIYRSESQEWIFPARFTNTLSGSVGTNNNLSWANVTGSLGVTSLPFRVFSSTNTSVITEVFLYAIGRWK